MYRDNITTRLWGVMVMWKDGSIIWIHLKYIKDSKPVEVAEYAVSNHIQERSEFDWWFSKVLRLHNIIIYKVKSKYWSTTHNFGIQLPNNFK